MNELGNLSVTADAVVNDDGITSTLERRHSLTTASVVGISVWDLCPFASYICLFWCP